MANSRLALEALLIVVSVAVGFAASQFGEYRANRALEQTVLKSVRDEVEGNLALIEPLLVKRREWQQALASADASRSTKSAFDILFELRPEGGVSIGVPLRRVAWHTAVSSGALSLLDYDVAAALSEIYGYQDLMTENHNRFVSSALYTPTTFDPASRVASARMLWGVLSEMTGNEEALRDLYRKNLPLLQRAAAD